jgi:copper homeostasis protein
MASVTVEIVCTSVSDALVTERSGASRIELCSALELGGLTPSLGLLESVKNQVQLPVMAMVRPRPGGFDYDDEEIRVMERDAQHLISSGADGIVFGILSETRSIRRDDCRRLLAIAAGRPCVFHRAFDSAPNLFQSLESLLELGFTRVLTSGGKGTAYAGIDILRTLRQKSDGRIEILPGGGIRSDNATEIIRRTGCNQIHLAPLRTVSTSDSGTASSPGVDYGDYQEIDGEAVAATVRTLRSIKVDT